MKVTDRTRRVLAYRRAEKAVYNSLAEADKRPLGEPRDFLTGLSTTFATNNTPQTRYEELGQVAMAGASFVIGSGTYIGLAKLLL